MESRQRLRSASTADLIIPRVHCATIGGRASSIAACGGDQDLLSGMFTEVKQRRHPLVLGWVTVMEDRAKSVHGRGP